MGIRIFNAVSELPDDLLKLLESAPEGSFDQTECWFSMLAKHILEPAESLRLVGISADDNRTSVVLPLILRSGFFAAGSSISALSNYYTAHFGPVTASSTDLVDVGSRLGEAVFHLQQRWHTLDLNPLGDDEDWITSFSEELESRGCFVQRYARFGNWYHPLNGASFQDYYGGLSSRVRNTITRKQKKLHRETEASVAILTSATDAKRAMLDYAAIYKTSWKQEEPFPRFIEDIVIAFAERGWLRLGLLTVDSKPAAAQIWFVRNGTASIFKLAYDPEFAKYSVGSVLTKALMEHVIEIDRVHTLDYLCGDDAYKRDWMSRRRERVGLRAYRKTSIIGAIMTGRQHLVQAIRHLRPKKSGNVS